MILLVDVIHIPKTGLPHLPTLTVPTEPAVCPWVNLLLIKVTEEGDSVLFEVRPVTIGTL